MNRKLSEKQISILLENFFKHKDYAGWKNIATKLITEGRCTVAGDKCIWIDGIGNFIKTENADGLFGCLVYKFDLEYFLSSAYYKEIRKCAIVEVRKKFIEAECEYNAFLELI